MKYGCVKSWPSIKECLWFPLTMVQYSLSGWYYFCNHCNCYKSIAAKAFDSKSGSQWSGCTFRSTEFYLKYPRCEINLLSNCNKHLCWHNAVLVKHFHSVKRSLAVINPMVTWVYLWIMFFLKAFRLFASFI